MGSECRALFSCRINYFYSWGGSGLELDFNVPSRSIEACFNPTPVQDFSEVRKVYLELKGYAR